MNLLNGWATRMIDRAIRRTRSPLGRSASAVVLAIGVILIGAVAVPTASAGLVEEVTGTVGSTVKSVQDGANAIPSPPSTTPPTLPSAPTPPATPPSPVATPAPPPQAPVKLPGKEAPAPPSRAGDDSADPPPVDRVAGAVQGAADSVTSAGKEAATRGVTPGRSGNYAATAPQHRADRGASENPGGRGASENRADQRSEAIVRGSRTSSSPPVAVRAAEVAALQRWLARVWPAVALGGSGAGIIEVITGGLFRPALATVAGLLLANSPILPTSGDASLAGHQGGVAGAARSSAPNPVPPPPAAEGGSVLYLIAIAALLAMLAFTVWREFRIALHPRLR